MRNDYKGITTAALLFPTITANRYSLEQNPEVARGIGACLQQAGAVKALRSLTQECAEIMTGSARNPAVLADMLMGIKTGPTRGHGHTIAAMPTLTPQ